VLLQVIRSSSSTQLFVNDSAVLRSSNANWCHFCKVLISPHWYVFFLVFSPAHPPNLWCCWSSDHA
jgi:hypothetical protein